MSWKPAWLNSETLLKNRKKEKKRSQSTREPCASEVQSQHRDRPDLRLLPVPCNLILTTVLPRRQVGRLMLPRVTQEKDFEPKSGHLLPL